MKKILINLVKKEIKILTMIIVIIGLATIIGIGLPLVLQSYIDCINISSIRVTHLYRLSILFFIGGVILFLFNNLKVCLAEKISWKMCDDLRILSIERIIHNDQEFFTKFKQGEIVEGIDKDIDKLEMYIKDTLLPIVVNVFNILGIIIVLWFTNWRLSLFIICFLCISFSALIHEINRNDELIIQERNLSNQLNGFYGEVIDNRIEINLFGRMGSLLKMIESYYFKLKDLKIQKQMFLYHIWITTLILFVFANALSFLIGGSLYFSGEITIGTIYVLYKYIDMVKSPMEEFQVYVQQTIDLKGALVHLNGIINFRSKMIEGNEIINSKKIKIEVKELSYAYENEDVLHNINLEFPLLKKIGIFGESGSGKSTLCKIISKQLGIQYGQVFINGVDINKISVNEARSKFGYITADASVLDGNIIENFKVFDDSIDENKIKGLYDEGVLSEFFSSFRSKSWDELKDMNLNQVLSTGEKQLFVLFRLLFNDKLLYIFDEASSVIETNVEKKFYELFEKVAGNATSIIVTHNVERLKRCDYIVVMKKGSILEQGEAEELLKDETSNFHKYAKQEWRLINE